MQASLEDRVKLLEVEVLGLKTLLTSSVPTKHDWRSTFGHSRDDSGFEEMIRLGREIREFYCLATEPTSKKFLD